MQEAIEERISAQFHEAGVRSFEPMQFVEQGLGSQTDVLRGFKDLMDTGALKGRALVRCAFGHSMWLGRMEDFKEVLHAACPQQECESHQLDEEELADEENTPEVVMRFDLTERYVLELADQKKKP